MSEYVHVYLCAKSRKQMGRQRKELQLDGQILQYTCGSGFLSWPHRMIGNDMPTYHHLLRSPRPRYRRGMSSSGTGHSLARIEKIYAFIEGCISYFLYGIQSSRNRVKGICIYWKIDNFTYFIQEKNNVYLFKKFNTEWRLALHSLQCYLLKY